jgi:hypothetical protein
MRANGRMALIVAVVFAVGIVGTAGATKLITGGQIKNGSIGLVDLSKSARKALAGKTGSPGPQGPQGGQGAAGTPGAPGPASIATTVRSQQFVAPPNDFADGEVRCPNGMVAVGGSVSPGALAPVFDAPSPDGRGWVGSAFELAGDSGSSMLVFVICTPGSAHVLPVGSLAKTLGEAKAQAQARRALG